MKPANVSGALFFSLFPSQRQHHTGIVLVVAAELIGQCARTDAGDGMSISTGQRLELEGRLITPGMNMQYRDHRDGLATILEVLYSGGNNVGITHLMFVSEITWTGLLPLLKELVEKEMITCKVMRGMKPKARRNHRVFSITQKGIRFLTLYKKLKGLLEIEKKER